MTLGFVSRLCPLFALACLSLMSAPVLAQTAPPELAVAERAVQQATQADADQYATDLVNQARQELMQAQQSMGDRKGRKLVPQLAAQAAADADLARVRSEQAVAQAQLQQRQAEVAKLQADLAAGEAH